MELLLALLKAMLNYKTYRKYFDSLDMDFIERSNPHIFRCFKVLPMLHESKTDKTYLPIDLKVALSTAYPKLNVSEYSDLLTDMAALSYDETIMDKYVESVAARGRALRLARTALEVANGTKDSNELSNFIEELEDVKSSVRETTFVTDDLEEIYQSTFKKQGLRWRLRSLNKALGSLRKGDFGMIYGRPEVGKTAMLASQVTYMATQLAEEDGPILWFNNEEGGDKVKLRCIQATLNMLPEEVFADRLNNQGRYLELTHGKLKIKDEAMLTKQSVEEICEEYQPSLIIFDQLDKIHGFAADRNDLELKAIYGWARELAKKYGPVIAVCQAAATGDQKQWLGMNDVDSSKVGKQGECDWILGIGQSDDFGKEYVRYLHLSKNKLLGDSDSDPSMRHGRWSCVIVPEKAMYKDFNSSGTVEED